MTLTYKGHHGACQERDNTDHLTHGSAVCSCAFEQCRIIAEITATTGHYTFTFSFAVLLDICTLCFRYTTFGKTCNGHSFLVVATNGKETAVLTKYTIFHNLDMCTVIPALGADTLIAFQVMSYKNNQYW